MAFSTHSKTQDPRDLSPCTRSTPRLSQPMEATVAQHGRVPFPIRLRNSDHGHRLLNRWVYPPFLSPRKHQSGVVKFSTAVFEFREDAAIQELSEKRCGDGPEGEAKHGAGADCGCRGEHVVLVVSLYEYSRLDMPILVLHATILLFEFCPSGSSSHVFVRTVRSSCGGPLGLSPISAHTKMAHTITPALRYR